MGRGIHLVTKVKKQIQQAMIEAETIRLASLEVEQKVNAKKPFLEYLKEHLFKMIDRIDPMETAAIMAGTYVIHETVIGIAEVATAYENLKVNNDLKIANFIKESMPDTVLSGLSQVIYPMSSDATPKEFKLPLVQDSLLIWLICFLISWLIVKHGADIITSFGGLGKITTKLLGVL